MSERVRLCIVSPFQYGGGAEYQIGCLADVLGPVGKFDIFYLLRHPETNISSPYYEVVKVGRGHHAPRFGYLVDALALYRALSRIRPHVIYQRVACGYTGISAHYARRHGIPMVWHAAHESDISGNNDVFGRNPMRRALERLSIEYGIRHASCVVTQTHDQARLLTIHYGRYASAVIPNFQPEPTERIQKDELPIVAWIANLKPWKRPEAFVRLARALSALSEVRFVMVGEDQAGSGNQEWRAVLLSAIKNTANLEYVGSLHQSKVNELLARATIFVNTSTQEGFPNTFIQAWMRGTPVVSLSVDPDNILERERIGVHAQTEENMVKAVQNFITDKTMRETYAQRARAYALSKHSLHNARVLGNLLWRNAVPEGEEIFKELGKEKLGE